MKLWCAALILLACSILQCYGKRRESKRLNWFRKRYGERPNTGVRSDPYSCIRAEDFCNPNWTPYDNMVAGTLGYNIRDGSPMVVSRDPGFKGQIFLPTYVDDTGKVNQDPAITAAEVTYCEKTLTTKSHSSLESYRKYVTDSSKSGVNLQVGTETEVTAGIDIGSIESVIPPAFTTAWEDSKEFQELSSLFKEEKVMISSSQAICNLYQMQLTSIRLPAFSSAFTDAVGLLYDAVSKDHEYQRSVFQNFINEFGTHYLENVVLGAQISYETMYIGEARNRIDGEALEQCSMKKGAKFFGIQLEQDTSKCTSENEEILSSYGNDVVRTSIVSKGSRPVDIESWAQQDFTPIPLSFVLNPIANIFLDKHIEARLLEYEGEKINSTAIREWFVPLYFQYCTSMNLSCGLHIGCSGIDDQCPVESVCSDSETGFHRCSEWSGWTCNVRCGSGNEEKRTRTCEGCSGAMLSETREKACTRTETECDQYKDLPCNEHGCYYLSAGEDKIATWEAAKTTCKDKGMELASIHSREELIELKETIMGVTPTDPTVQEFVSNKTYQNIWYRSRYGSLSSAQKVSRDSKGSDDAPHECETKSNSLDKYAYIGLYCNNIGEDHQWVDETMFDYVASYQRSYTGRNYDFLDSDRCLTADACFALSGYYYSSIAEGKLSGDCTKERPYICKFT